MEEVRGSSPRVSTNWKHRIMRSVISTICSKEKSPEQGLIPARNRYLSERINQVGKIALDANLEFLILSGEYGLIGADQEIPYYDHLLKIDEVDDLTDIVKKQIFELKADEIIFYAKPNADTWVPYYSVIENATKASGVNLNVKLI